LGGILSVLDFFSQYNRQMSDRANAFLSQFIEMRRGIAAQNPSAAQAAAAQMPKSKKTKKTSSKQAFTDGGIQGIIEHKPGKKEVMEFLQKRCDELTAEKMA